MADSDQHDEEEKHAALVETPDVSASTSSSKKKRKKKKKTKKSSKKKSSSQKSSSDASSKTKTKKKDKSHERSKSKTKANLLSSSSYSPSRSKSKSKRKSVTFAKESQSANKSAKGSSSDSDAVELGSVSADKESKKAKKSESSGDYESRCTKVYRKLQRIPFVGDIMDYCFLPVWTVLVVIWNCIASFYNKAFPEEDDIVDTKSWQWGPEDLPEFIMYWTMLTMFTASLVHLIGQLCIDYLDDEEVEKFIAHPIVMALVFPPFVFGFIVFMFVASKGRNLHLLHFEIPMVLFVATTVLTAVVVTFAEHSLLNMKLKCLNEDRDVSANTCSEWFGAWRVSLSGMAIMILCMIVLGVVSVWRWKSVIELHHLNTHTSKNEELIRPPKTASDRQVESNRSDGSTESKDLIVKNQILEEEESSEYDSESSRNSV